MPTNKKKRLAWGLFGLYFFAVTQIILVKYPRFFIWRMGETFRRHNFEWIGLRANYKPFKTIWHLLIVDFELGPALLNIGGNIILFIPMGIFLPMYFKAPHKTLKTILTCLVLSASFEVFQLVTACGFFDIDDIFLNTLGGATGLWMYSRFMNKGRYTHKKVLVKYAPN